MEERRLVRSERSVEGNYDIFEIGAGPEEMYVDGFVGQSIGASVIRTDLYSAIGIKEEGEIAVEQRLLKLRLIVPTSVFVEMCVKTLAALKSNEAQMKGAFDATRDQILNYLSQVEVATPQEEPR